MALAVSSKDSKGLPCMKDNDVLLRIDKGFQMYISCSRLESSRTPVNISRISL